MYTYRTYVRMHDTDAAGVIFFANQLQVAHLAFEAFLDSVGLGLGAMIAEKDYRMPIVHAETDFKAPIYLGDELTIQLTAKRIGNSSFTLDYRVLNQDGLDVGSARTIHCAVDRDSWKKRPIPDEIRNALEENLKP